ncbi:enolase-phosphatase E1-like isoform X3 [Hyperolius riggenbachi]|uniref:enolase-phosphatase E1-like isoform X3 n=1 Tax=Hyperolius riggenbachi TaxID=752182 RepID=UPI0035A30E67
MSAQSVSQVIAKHLNGLEHNQLELFTVILCQMKPPLKHGNIWMEDLRGKSVDHIASIIVKRHTTRHASATVEKILTEMKELNARMDFKKEIRAGSRHKKKVEASGSNDLSAIINDLFGENLRQLASTTEDTLTQNQEASSSFSCYPLTCDDSEEGSASEEDDSPQSQVPSSPLSPVCPQTPGTESSEDGSDLEVSESEEEEMDEGTMNEEKRDKRMNSNQSDQSMLIEQDSCDIPGSSPLHEAANEIRAHKRKREEQKQDMAVKATGVKTFRNDKKHKNVEKNNVIWLSSTQSVQKVKKTPDTSSNPIQSKYFEDAKTMKKQQRTPGQQIEAESEEAEMDEGTMNEGRRDKRRLISNQSEEKTPVEPESCDTQRPDQFHKTANKIRDHKIKEGQCMQDMVTKVPEDQICGKKNKNVEKKYDIMLKPNQSKQTVKKLPDNYRIPRLPKSNEADNKMETCNRKPGPQPQDDMLGTVAESEDDEMDDERINEGRHVNRRLSFNQPEQSMLIQAESRDIQRPSKCQTATKEIQAAHERKPKKQMQGLAGIVTGNQVCIKDKETIEGRINVDRRQKSNNKPVQMIRKEIDLDNDAGTSQYNQTANTTETCKRKPNQLIQGLADITTGKQVRWNDTTIDVGRNNDDVRLNHNMGVQRPVTDVGPSVQNLLQRYETANTKGAPKRKSEAPLKVIRDETGNQVYRVDRNNVGRSDVPRPSSNQLLIQPNVSPMAKPIQNHNTGNNKEAHQRKLEQLIHDSQDTVDIDVQNQDCRKDKKEKKDLRGNDGTKRNSNQSAQTLTTQSDASPKPGTPQCNNTGRKGAHERQPEQQIKEMNDSLAGTHTPKRSDEKKHVSKRSNSGQRLEPELQPCNISGPSKDYDTANKRRSQGKKSEQQIQNFKSQDRLEKCEEDRRVGQHNDAERSSLSPRKMSEREQAMFNHSRSSQQQRNYESKSQDRLEKCEEDRHVHQHNDAERSSLSPRKTSEREQAKYEHPRSSHERIHQRRNYGTVSDTSEKIKEDRHVRQHDDAERSSPPPGGMRRRIPSPNYHPGPSRERTGRRNYEDRHVWRPEEAERSSPHPVRWEREHYMIEHPGSSRERTQQGNYGQPPHQQWRQSRQPSNNYNRRPEIRNHAESFFPRINTRGPSQHYRNAQNRQESLPLQSNDIPFHDYILPQQYPKIDPYYSDYIPFSSPPMLLQAPLDLDMYMRDILEMQRGSPPRMDERR